MTSHNTCIQWPRACNVCTLSSSSDYLQEQAEDIEGAPGSEHGEEELSLSELNAQVKSFLGRLQFQILCIGQDNLHRNYHMGGNNDKNVSYNFPWLVNMSSTLSSFLLFDQNLVEITSLLSLSS